MQLVKKSSPFRHDNYSNQPSHRCCLPWQRALGNVREILYLVQPSCTSSTRRRILVNVLSCVLDPPSWGNSSSLAAVPQPGMRNPGGGHFKPRFAPVIRPVAQPIARVSTRPLLLLLLLRCDGRPSALFLSLPGRWIEERSALNWSACCCPSPLSLSFSHFKQRRWYLLKRSTEG